ncbi:VWA domain-containing protein [Myxococcota bacterium]|nr:VWA domain-containing protein [Myxococcota bacterium]
MRTLPISISISAATFALLTTALVLPGCGGHELVRDDPGAARPEASDEDDRRTVATGEKRPTEERAQDASPKDGLAELEKGEDASTRGPFPETSAVVAPTSEPPMADVSRDDAHARQASKEKKSAAREYALGGAGYGRGAGGMVGSASAVTGGYAPPPPVARPAPEFNTEAYDHVADNAFVAVADQALSTFSIDVDTASYSNVRRFLDGGTLPPKDAVRIEELVNYFDYDYPGPRSEQPFAAVTEVSECPWNPSNRLVHIGLQGRRIDMQDLPPLNLVFLLDVSGSMNSPDKLPLVKQGMAMLVEQLRPQDRIAITVYAGAAGLVLPSTPGSQKRPILDALDRLSAGGSTAGGAGIQLAYRIAQDNFRKGAVNRVILATDGDFNVGTTSQGDLVRLIEAKRESGVFLTVLGFGTGNLKDATMEKLADKGNGNYAYIDSADEARKALGREVGASLVTIAKDVKVQVEWNPQQVASYRLVGYENRMLAAQDFNDDKKDAGEIGAGHSVTALYEVVPAGRGTAGSGVDPLRYQAGRAPTAAASSGEMMTVKLRYKEPEGSTSKLISFPVSDRGKAFGSTSDDFRFSAAVAAYGMLLRDSEHRGRADFGKVESWARGALGEDPSGDRRDFLRLVGIARSLQGQDTVADVTTR